MDKFKMKIVLLTRDNNVSNFLSSGLVEKGIRIEAIIYEKSKPQNKALLIKKIKKAFKKNIFSMIDLLLTIPFIILEMRLIEKYFQNKIVHLDLPKYWVDDISDPGIAKVIEGYRPDLILVYGTSIIKGELLELENHIINIHMGKTSVYRGSKNEFWAALQDDFGNIGVTLHKLDAGIDTGPPLHFIDLNIKKIKPYYRMRIENIENLVKEMPSFLNVYQPKYSLKSLTNNQKGRLYSTPNLSARFKYLIKMITEKFLNA